MDDDEQEPPQNETVVVYKNDSSALFSPSETAEKDGITSRAYEKELGTAKINGLLSGSIRMYGDYVAVTTELRIYPGAKLAGTVTEVGTVSDQMDLAERIVQQLVPVIANSLPVQLHFEILPEEIAEKAHLTLDGLVYSKIPTDLQVDASIHTINVSAKGYDTASFTYKFEGNERYTIRISLSRFLRSAQSAPEKTERRCFSCKRSGRPCGRPCQFCGSRYGKRKGCPWYLYDR